MAPLYLNIYSDNGQVGVFDRPVLGAKIAFAELTASLAFGVTAAKLKALQLSHLKAPQTLFRRVRVRSTTSAEP